ncbi:MAG: hypothetical protein ACMXYB_01750 [Candidatus Woesearchaeota archaeon]
MAKVDESCIIRFKKGNLEVEALVEYKTLAKYLEKEEKEREEVSIYDIFADTKIFSDSKKGLVVDSDTLEKLFPNKNEEEILKEIAQNGDAQIPTSYLNELRERKKDLIVNYLTNQTINPQTKHRYTTTMLKDEIENLKISILPFRNHIKQAEDVFKELKHKIPIKFDSTIIILQVESQYAGLLIKPVREFGTIEKQFYDDSGNLHMHLKVPTGRVDETIEFLKNKTKGSASYHLQKDD